MYAQHEVIPLFSFDEIVHIKEVNPQVHLFGEQVRAFSNTREGRVNTSWPFCCNALRT